MKCNMIIRKNVVAALFFALIFVNVQAQNPKKRLLVFDKLITNFNALAEQKTLSDDVLILAENNPLESIAQFLQMHSFDEIHIYALTKPGSIIFDQLNITNENIEESKRLFEIWKSLISPETTIIIHSTVLASNSEGKQLVNTIEVYTGVEVKIQE